MPRKNKRKNKPTRKNYSADYIENNFSSQYDQNKSKVDKLFDIIENNKPMRDFLRGEIYIIDPPDYICSSEALGKKRPAVVISDVAGNHGSFVRMVPFTSQKRANMVTNVNNILLDGVSSTAICSLATPIPIERIFNLIGICSNADMIRISEALAYADGIHNIYMQEISKNIGAPNDISAVHPISNTELDSFKEQFELKEKIYLNTIKSLKKQKGAVKQNGCNKNKPWHRLLHFLKIK